MMVLIPALFVLAVQDALPAFPGAEGFGSKTPGGRGGRVIKVTTLNARGPGSFQEACSAEGPRIVVFDVSGVIEGDVVITQPRITIAGETAPGAGITIYGRLATSYRRNVEIHDVIVRFLRVRVPPGRGSQGDAIQFSVVRNAILDHVSCAWAEDETVDLFTRARDVTLQWCTIEESSLTGHRKGVHNYGMIAGRRSNRLSIHHNLFAHHRRRIPAIGGGPVDFRNNVAYNIRDGLSHEGNYSGTPGINIVGNYYKRGPSDSKMFPFCFVEDVPYYLRDNFIHGVGVIQDPWKEADRHPGLGYYARRGKKQEKETPVPSVTTHSSEETLKRVLSRAGCFPRDGVTRRNVEDVRNATGSWGRKETDLRAGLTPGTPPKDSDGDGMPDAWERAQGLNPRDAGDSRKVLAGGYTAIERYCHERAKRLLEKGR